MKKIATSIDDLYLIQIPIYTDERGFFTEKYNRNSLNALGISENFVQDNHSRSCRHVIRGLHAQKGQGKLVGVASGSIFDVAVDMRDNSPTYKQYFAAELSAENGLQLWIPDGFLHGFKVTSDSADVIYKVTDYYKPAEEYGIYWADEDINIKWPEQNQFIISQRDSASPRLRDRGL